MLLLLVMESPLYADGDYYLTYGDGFRNTTLDRQASVLAQTMEDDFAARDYDAAVTTCAGAVADTIADIYGVDLAAGGAQSAPRPEGRRGFEPGVFVLAAALLVVMLILVFGNTLNSIFPFCFGWCLGSNFRGPRPPRPPRGPRPPRRGPPRALRRLWRLRRRFRRRRLWRRRLRRRRLRRDGRRLLPRRRRRPRPLTAPRLQNVLYKPQNATKAPALQALFLLYSGKSKRINIQNDQNKTTKHTHTKSRKLSKRKRKPKNTKSGLDTGGGVCYNGFRKEKDLPFACFGSLSFIHHKEEKHL